MEKEEKAGTSSNYQNKKKFSDIKTEVDFKLEVQLELATLALGTIAR